MKTLLNLVPRPWLIQLSIWFRPLIKLYFKGDQFTDPIDGSSYRKFLSYGHQNLRQNALCPGTLSLERHRLLWLYLDRKTTFLTDSIRVLHIAPEQVFYKKFKSFSHWDYTTSDLHSPLADVKADICALPFEDNSYDFILCNHVLEHIPNDLKAMEELYRVLKPGGTAILQVPLEEDRENTFEDDAITDQRERTRIFGQYDHVRVYGQDYYNRLEEVGFKATAVDFIKEISAADVKRFALPTERIPVLTKK
ncbi:MAG: methyltransferase domain-containing protein [Flavobacteriaceae bacterium]|nr:methyltransferase domain-containing protein [Flavobacteriaceae bacterium]MDG1090841.1 methyltransferase domain-containing protein [Flavobacteriaceae bacterium]